VRAAVERARNGNGPQAVEALSVRMHGHAAHDDARYVPDGMREEFAERYDPVGRLAARLALDGFGSPAIQGMRDAALAEVDAGLAEAEQAPAPDPATLEEKFVGTNSGRLESFSFTAPVAYLLELLILWTDTSRVLTFGIAGALGMIAGSLAYALVSRTFRWEGFGGVEDVGNHLAGAAMMGFGGVTALGCTIGQGLTGVSTLAIGSFITFGAIIAGCVAAVRYQTWRIERMA